MKKSTCLLTRLPWAVTGLLAITAPLTADVPSGSDTDAKPFATLSQQEAPNDPPAARTQPQTMTTDGLDSIIRKIDPEAKRDDNLWQFNVVERQVYVVADPNADRMRIMSPIIPADNITPALYQRMMQANFDAALDARYAIARDLVWSVFIHPLGSLSERELLSGTAQTVTAAVNFGTSFSSGAMVYGGGDTNGIIGRQLLDELLKKEGQPM